MSFMASVILALRSAVLFIRRSRAFLASVLGFLAVPLDMAPQRSGRGTSRSMASLQACAVI